MFFKAVYHDFWNPEATGSFTAPNFLPWNNLGRACGKVLYPKSLVVCLHSVSVFQEQSVTKNVYQLSLALFCIILDYYLEISFLT